MKQFSTLTHAARTASRYALAPLVALLCITLILALSTDNPGDTLQAFFSRPFSSWWMTGTLLDRTALLLIASCGVTCALKTGTFNLGGEVQLYAPALISATILTIPVPDSLFAHALLVSAALTAALLTGGLLAGLPALFKVRFGTNEMISTFLLSAASIPVLDYLISGPLRNPDGNLLATREIPHWARLPAFHTLSRVNISLIIAIVAILLCAVYFNRTRAGFRAGIVGIAPECARHAGFSVPAATMWGLTVSGIFHGLAGFSAVSGTWFMCHTSLTSGIGWSALAVALVAGNSFFALVPAAFLFAWLETASDAAILVSRFSFDTRALSQAIVFLLVSVRIATDRRQAQ